MPRVNRTNNRPVQLQLVTPPFALPDLSESVLVAKFFRALGDPRRLRILKAVLNEEKNVSDLVKVTGAPQ